jgi:chemotaxis protein methyltransferase CheR
VQRGLPIQMLVDNFTQEGANWLISEEIKNMVKFSPLNLLEPFSHLGTFDIVFCRNVLIYFDVPTKKKVLEAIHKLMKPDGFLLLGAAETMMGVTEVFERAEGHRGVYQPGAAQKAALTA